MKVIAIGDTHGRTDWKLVVKKERYDKFIFMGDYFDTRGDISASAQIKNFNEIAEYKRTHPDNVILLFGNHDFHYLSGVTEKYSGYQVESDNRIRKEIDSVYKDGLFDMVHLHTCPIGTKYLFSHAGVTKKWCANYGVNTEPSEIEESINRLFKSRVMSFKFQSGVNRSLTGDDITQSPIWVRPFSLWMNSVEGFVQVVGHTSVPSITLDESSIKIDTLDASKEYLLINNSVVTKEKVQ